MKCTWLVLSSIVVFHGSVWISVVAVAAIILSASYAAMLVLPDVFIFVSSTGGFFV